MTPTHYDTLGIQRTATGDEIKAAYRREASAAHPDKGGTDERMQAVNLAYQVLSDGALKAQYDATLPPVKNKSYVYTMADVGFAARGENFGQH